MPISVTDLAKQLEIAPEAVQLHAMDLDFEIGEDEMVPDEIAAEIRKIELGDEVKQAEHAIEDKLEREIVEKQQAKTAGQKKIAHKKKGEKKEPAKEEEEKVEVIRTDDGFVILPEMMTVRQLSLKISKPIPIVLVKLKQNGIIANLAQELDYETAAVIADELGVKVRKEAAKLTGEELFRADLSQLLKDEEKDQLRPRPPVISIMGHVDHGKTSLLDFIRKTKVAQGEAGGITQRIGAYQVEIPETESKSKTKKAKTASDPVRKITFLDTPGHEAFTVMRARGARATDIAILVVAATEGLKPQSIEAISHAKEANIPVIVAMNKIDLPGANFDQVKGQLADQGLNPEEWGGDTPCIPVSAKTGQGIDKLLEAINLIADLRELKANPNRPAIATVIESQMLPGIGPTATILVNTGTLHQGDAFVIYDQYGHIRTMKNFEGKILKTAGPSTPVQITGLAKLPHVGDIVQVMESERIARRKAEEVASISHEDALAKRQKFSLATMKTRLAEGKLQQLKVIVKADSQGTLEAVKSEVGKVKTEEGFAKVIHAGVGEISESDVMLASASGGTVVVGFNVSVTGHVKNLAEKEGVKVFTFDVIYHLTEKIHDLLLGKTDAEEKEQIVGEFKIKKIFASNKKMAVLGGTVVSGKVRKLSKFRLLREEKNEAGDKEQKLLGEAKIMSVHLGQKEINEMNEGTECGVKIEHDGLVFAEGDKLELFVIKK